MSLAECEAQVGGVIDGESARAEIERVICKVEGFIKIQKLKTNIGAALACSWRALCPIVLLRSPHP